MPKYNKKEYLKYVEDLKKDLPTVDARPIDFETWKWIQPIADEAVGISNKIIERGRRL